MRLKTFVYRDRGLLEKAFDAFSLSFDVIQVSCHTLAFEDETEIWTHYIVYAFYVLHKEKEDVGESDSTT